jgi:hypothetical protein
LDFPVTVTIKPFEASRLKIERARRHLNELRQATSTFLDRKPVEVVVEKWPEAPETLQMTAWTGRIRESVPREFSTIIGDLVHNLRTALDLLACDLVRLNGKEPNDVYFPFAGTAGDLEKMIRKRNMHRAGENVLRVLRSLKPYKGGNEMLRAIHDLDIDDKHKALIPAVHAASIGPLHIKLGAQVTALPQWDAYVMEDGHKILMMPSSLTVPTGTVIPATLRLVFGPDDRLAGREVLTSLHDLAETADGVVNAFAALFPGQVPQKNNIGKV